MCIGCIINIVHEGCLGGIAASSAMWVLYGLLCTLNLGNTITMKSYNRSKIMLLVFGGIYIAFYLVALGIALTGTPMEDWWDTIFTGVQFMFGIPEYHGFKPIPFYNFSSLAQYGYGMDVECKEK